MLDNIKRNSSFEILRIVSMIMIIIGHFSVFSGFENIEISNTLNRYFLDFIVLGNFGVNLFILISGYFGISSKFKLEKLLKLIFSVLFYSVIIVIIFILLGKAQFSVSSIKYLFPVSFELYWFATSYIMLYLFRPFINLLINSLDRNKHLILIIVMLYFWSIIPTFINKLTYTNGFIQMLMIYTIGAYLRKYQNNRLNDKKIYLFLTLSNFIIVFTSSMLLRQVSSSGYTHFYSKESIFVILGSIGLFLLFSNLKFEFNQFINTISSTTFGIYLIHEHPLMRVVLWKDIFKNYLFANNNLLLLYALAVVLIIFIASSIIEYFRILLIEKPFFKMNKSRIENISKKLDL